MRTLVASAVLMLGTPAQAGVLREPYGTTADGRAVDRYTLTRAGMTVRVLTYGGVVTEINTAGPGNLVLALPGLAAYEARPNFSSLIGRVANRTSGGAVRIDGTRYPLAASADGISSHGGPGGFSTKVWAATPGRDSVRLRYVSPAGENGYPGALTVDVTYRLVRGGGLRIDYRATTTKPTLVNLTSHMFFNLGRGPDIRAETLQVRADAYLPVEARKLPTGAVAPVAGTAFDLRTPVRLAERLDLPALAQAHGFDHNFVLSGRRAAVLADPASGRTLTVETSEPGLQVYTAGAFDGSLMGADGPLARWAGIALETQHFPDSANHPAFPSITLRPGQVFRSSTTYRFGRR